MNRRRLRKFSQTRLTRSGRRVERQTPDSERNYEWHEMEAWMAIHDCRRFEAHYEEIGEPPENPLAWRHYLEKPIEGDEAASVGH